MELAILNVVKSIRTSIDSTRYALSRRIRSHLDEARGGLKRNPALFCKLIADCDIFGRRIEVT